MTGGSKAGGKSAVGRAAVVRARESLVLTIGTAVVVGVMLATLGRASDGRFGSIFVLLPMMASGLLPAIWAALRVQPRAVRAEGDVLTIGAKRFLRARFRGARFLTEGSKHVLRLEGHRPLDAIALHFDDAAEARKFAAALGFDDAPSTHDAGGPHLGTFLQLVPIILCGAAGGCVHVWNDVVPWFAEMAAAIFGSASDTGPTYLEQLRPYVVVPFAAWACAAAITLVVVVFKWRFDWVVIGRDGIRMRSTLGARVGERFVSLEGVRGVEYRGGGRLDLHLDGDKTLTIRVAAEQARQTETVIRERLAALRGEQVPLASAIAREGRSVADWVRSLRTVAEREVAHYRDSALSAAQLRAIVASPLVTRAQRIAAALAFASMRADTRELVRIGEASGDPVLERVMVRIAGGAPDDELAAALEEAERAASAEAQA